MVRSANSRLPLFAHNHNSPLPPLQKAIKAAEYVSSPFPFSLGRRIFSGPLPSHIKDSHQLPFSISLLNSSISPSSASHLHTSSSNLPVGFTALPTHNMAPLQPSRASQLQARDTAMPKMDPLADSKWLPLPKPGNMGGNMGGGFGGEVWFKSESPQPALSSAPAATLAPSSVLVAATVQTLAPAQAAPVPLQSVAPAQSVVPVQASAPVQSYAPVQAAASTPSAVVVQAPAATQSYLPAPASSSTQLLVPVQAVAPTPSSRTSVRRLSDP